MTDKNKTETQSERIKRLSPKVPKLAKKAPSKQSQSAEFTKRLIARVESLEAQVKDLTEATTKAPVENKAAEKEAAAKK